MSTTENQAPSSYLNPGTPPSDGVPGLPGGGMASTPKPRGKRRWLVPVVIATAFVVGIAAGAASTPAPTATTEYRELSAQLDQAKSAITTANDRADTADARAETASARADTAEATAAAKSAALDTRSTELDTRSAKLDTRQGDLEKREGAVASTEKKIAASQIADGTWTVGTDIQPGTYRVAAAVTSRCYWAILRSGSNGGDIVENDLPQGGFPSVTLSVGQDFENSCGMWNKQ